MAEHALTARPRVMSGKKCRYLRRAGITPANLYGAELKSIALQVDTKEIQYLLTTVSRNAPVALTIKGEPKPRTAFVWKIQRHPLDGSLVHVDLYHVDPNRRMRAQVPLVLADIDPNLGKLDRRINLMVQVVEVESLPAALPTSIAIDGNRLHAMDDEVRVKDLVVSDKVHILTNPELPVAKVAGILELREGASVAEAAAVEPGAVGTVEGKAEEGEAPDREE